MARKRYDEEPRNHDRWLISYADFITLLFAFFVVMYAISVGQRRQVQGAFRFAGRRLRRPAGWPQPPASRNPSPDQPAIRKRAKRRTKRERERLTKLARLLNASLAPLVKRRQGARDADRRGVRSRSMPACCSRKGEARLAGESRARAAGGRRTAEERHACDPGRGPYRQPADRELGVSVELGIVGGAREQRGAPVHRGRRGAEALTAVGACVQPAGGAQRHAGGRARNRRVAVTILSDVVTDRISQQIQTEFRKPKLRVCPGGSPIT
jgi:chemotaxis protein MotB